MLLKIQEFFKEVSVELKKVSWRTRQQTMNATLVVITVSFIVAFFLGIATFQQMDRRTLLCVMLDTGDRRQRRGDGDGVREVGGVSAA